jgi:hypothetical protein
MNDEEKSPETSPGEREVAQAPPSEDEFPKPTVL